MNKPIPGDPKLLSVVLYWNDGTVDKMDQITSYDINEEDCDQGCNNLRLKNCRYRTFVNTDDFTLNIIKSCPYLLPCGICDRNKEMCSRYQ